jgi:hypothetical protein
MLIMVHRDLDPENAIHFWHVAVPYLRRRAFGGCKRKFDRSLLNSRWDRNVERNLYRLAAELRRMKLPPPDCFQRRSIKVGCEPAQNFGSADVAVSVDDYLEDSDAFGWCADDNRRNSRDEHGSFIRSPDATDVRIGARCRMIRTRRRLEGGKF